jgi:hypothetical protein
LNGRGDANLKGLDVIRLALNKVDGGGPLLHQIPPQLLQGRERRRARPAPSSIDLDACGAVGVVGVGVGVGVGVDVDVGVGEEEEVEFDRGML